MIHSNAIETKTMRKNGSCLLKKKVFNYNVSVLYMKIVIDLLGGGEKKF